jgi:endonuclease YncB( thermonuclease family)
MTVRSQITKIRETAGYKALLKKVSETLIEGRRRVEKEGLRTYWETGREVNAHLARYSGGEVPAKGRGNAAYGEQVVILLAEDLEMGELLLYRCIRFHQTYPDFQKVSGWKLFKWSHYRGLITVPDDKRRSSLEKASLKNDWTSGELALRIKEARPVNASSGVTVPARSAASGKQGLLTPLRGELYTYRLVERPNLSPGAEGGLLVDLGFGVFHEVDAHLLSAFSKDQIIESRPKDDAYKFYQTGRTVKDLFTYAAYVERVIDGDTLKVRFDLGFNVWMRETLRLRDIDCPEVGTPEGDEAKAFVRSHLKEAQQIIVRSSRSDKYARYLADVFIPSVDPGSRDEQRETSDDIYLNNLLLETRRAVRM